MIRHLARLVLVVLLLCARLASAQTVTLTRNVNLRPTPSTIEDPKALLKPPTVLALLSPAKDEGYYKVRAPDGQEGFVWAKNVRLDQPTTPVPPTPTPTSTPTIAPMAVALPTLPSCTIPDSTKSRWDMKTRPSSSAAEQSLSVNQMITGAVPMSLPSSARTSNVPIHQRETDQKVYRLTGWVRAVRLQDNDCEFHVEVASTAAEGSPRVIVEIPQKEETAARTLMSLVGMASGGQTKTLSPAKAVKLQFVGYAFLDQWHQTNPATKTGHGHGGNEVKTLWELHPVWEVRK